MKKSLFLVMVLWMLTSTSMERKAISLDDFVAALTKAYSEDIEPWIAMAKTGKVDVNQKDSSGRPLLNQAVLHNKLDVLKELLQVPGIAVNAKDKAGRTPLIQAVFMNRLEALRMLLLAPGTDVNAQDKFGQTALMFAASSGKIEAIKELLRASGIDINKTDNEGATALMKAVGSDQATTMLLQVRGIDVNAKNNAGSTSLMLAAILGKLDVLKELLQTPEIRVNEKDRAGRTALSLAITNRNADVARFLWAVGADDTGITNIDPGMLKAKEEGRAVFDGIKTALLHGDTKTPEEYVHKGYSLMIRDEKGNGPVHLAIIGNQVALANYLLARNANLISQKNNEGITPLEAMYGLYGEHNEDWNKFLAELPVKFRAAIVDAKKGWEAYKQKAFEAGVAGMKVST
jgi:ankyrin repeat protein